MFHRAVMSSHHIVRENQEPALLIASASAISFEKIQELLEWMPTVVVLDNQVEQVIAWGIKVDIVVVPFSEMALWRDKLTDQSPIRIISYNPGDDPIVTAFYFLLASKVTAVNCLLSSIEDLKRVEVSASLDIEAFIENILWSFLRKGHFEKWFPAGTKLYLSPEEMKTEFTQFSSGSYQTTEDGIIALKSNHSFWIGEEMI